MLFSDILLHLDDAWTLALGSVMGVPMTWQMGVVAFLTPLDPLATTYILMTQQISVLVVGSSSSASNVSGLASAAHSASSSRVLGVIGTHICPSFLSRSISSASQSQFISYARPSSSALLHCQSLFSLLSQNITWEIHIGGNQLLSAGSSDHALHYSSLQGTYGLVCKGLHVACF